MLLMKIRKKKEYFSQIYGLWPQLDATMRLLYASVKLERKSCYILVLWGWRGKRVNEQVLEVSKWNSEFVFIPLVYFKIMTVT